MRILTAENNCFEMTDFPEEVDDLRFAVLDNSNPKDPDYFFIPLIFLETFRLSSIHRFGNRVHRSCVYLRFYCCRSHH